MKKRYLLVTILTGIVLLFGNVALAHEVSVFDTQENLIIRAYSSTYPTDPTCSPGPFCVNLEVRDPNSTPSGNLVPLADLVGLNANPLQVHADASTDDLSLAFDDKTGTTFLFCKNGNFMVMTYNIGRAGAPTCTSFTYSNWGTCQANGTQSRTIISTTPAVCTGGTPAALTQSCTPTSGLPDLVVTRVAAPSAAGNGVGFSLIAYIANIGTGSAGSFTVKAYVGNYSTPPGDQLVCTAQVSGLGAGQSTSVNLSGCKFGDLGLHFSYYLLVVVDADAQVPESNEGNNLSMRGILVL
jgi:hypothetical protein